MAKTGKITVCAGPGEEFVVREHELPQVEVLVVQGVE